MFFEEMAFLVLFTYVTKLEESAISPICFAVTRRDTFYEEIRASSSKTSAYFLNRKVLFYFIGSQVLNAPHLKVSLANSWQNLFCLGKYFYFPILHRYLLISFCLHIYIFCDSWFPSSVNRKPPRGLAKNLFQWRTCFLILKLDPSYFLGTIL